MTDALETQLQRELREAADDAPVPPVDVDALVERGRQGLRARRRRTGLIIVAAAASVSVVVGGVTLVRSYVDTSPGTGKGDQVATQPPTVGGPTTEQHTKSPRLRFLDLPHGPAPSVPYDVGTQVFVAGRALDIGHSSPDAPSPEIATSNGRSVVITDRGVFAVTGGHATRLTAPGDFPVVSMDGHFGVWETRSGSHIALAEWNLLTGKEVARFVTPLRHSGCCGGGDIAYPLGIDALGRVYLSSGSTPIWVWDPRVQRWGEVSDLRQHGADATGVGRLNLFIHIDAPFLRMKAGGLAAEGHTVYGFVSASRRFIAQGSVRGAAGNADSSGQRVVTSDLAGHHVAVVALSSGQATPIHLPSDVVSAIGGPVWESESNILFAVDVERAHESAIIRCSTSTGRCEVAAGPARSISLGQLLT